MVNQWKPMMRVFIVFILIGLVFPSTAQTHKSLFNKGKDAYNEGNYQQALEYFNQAIEKNKANTPISLKSRVIYHNWRGAANSLSGNYFQAVKDLTYAIRNRKDFDGDKWVPAKIHSDYYWRGYAQRMQGNYAVAMADFNQAIELDPNHGNSYANMGWCYVGLEQYQQALKSFDEAMVAGSESFGTYRGKAISNYRLHKFQQALSNYTKAFELNDQDMTNLSGQAMAIAHMGQYDRSIEIIDNAIERNQGNDNYLYFQRARIQGIFSKEIEVLEDMEKAFDLGFNDWESLGIYLYEFGSFAEDPRLLQLLIDNDAQIGLMGATSNAQMLSKLNQQRNQNLSYEELKANPESKEQTTATVATTKSETVKKKSDIDMNIPVSDVKKENYFAVVIGNENYNNEITVTYAINDAQSFKSYLEKTVGIPGSNIHYVEDATYGELLDEIDWLNKITSAFKSEARIFFYYAGHGVPDDETKGAFLLPTDGNSTRTNTAIGLDYLYSNLTANETESVTVFLDACFSGSSREGNLTEGRGVRIKPKEEVLKGNLVVFSASSGDQTAYPYPDQQHGLFTYFLLKKLKETNGTVNYGELADFLKIKVNQRAIVTSGQSQNPQINASPQMINWSNLKF